MKRKTDAAPNKRKWAIYLIVGVLLLVGAAFFSGKNQLRLTEERFDQTLDFIKSQSTSYEKYNDIVTAKALRHEAVSVHQLADDPTLDLSDSQCSNGIPFWMPSATRKRPMSSSFCWRTGLPWMWPYAGRPAKTWSCLPIGTPPQNS